MKVVRRVLGAKVVGATSSKGFLVSSLFKMKAKPKIQFTSRSLNGISRQVSAAADEPARRAASPQTCCKQRWTLSVMNLRPN